MTSDTETNFDFLACTFRPRSVVNRRGELFVGFDPSVSRRALKAMNARCDGGGSTLSTYARWRNQRCGSTRSYGVAGVQTART